MRDWVNLFLFVVMGILTISRYCDNRKRYKEKPSEARLKVLNLNLVSAISSIIGIVICLVFLIIAKF